VSLTPVGFERKRGSPRTFFRILGRTRWARKTSNASLGPSSLKVNRTHGVDMPMGPETIGVGTGPSGLLEYYWLARKKECVLLVLLIIFLRFKLSVPPLASALAVSRQLAAFAGIFFHY
jgi:hypothetical protein